MSDVTRILSQIDAGDPSAAEQLIDLDGDGAIDPGTESGWYSFNDLRPGIHFVDSLTSAGFFFGLTDRIQTSPPIIRPQPEVIGEVTSGPGEPPSPGLAPDLTLDIVRGLGDWFVTGSVLHFGQATPNIGRGRWRSSPARTRETASGWCTKGYTTSRSCSRTPSTRPARSPSIPSTTTPTSTTMPSSPFWRHCRTPPATAFPKSAAS